MPGVDIAHAALPLHGWIGALQSIDVAPMRGGRLAVERASGGQDVRAGASRECQRVALGALPNVEEGAGRALRLPRALAGAPTNTPHRQPTMRYFSYHD